MSRDAAVGGSFRDPSGFVFVDSGTLYRQVNRSYRGHYEALIASGLYRDLVERGLLVPHEEAAIGLALSDEAYKVIRPQPVPFVSYPYEWCFGQLKAAALATLELQRIALSKSMTLKDASAYNVQFIGTRPVFIDTLSFERYEEGAPWAAYRQFCQHFLAPLALMAYRDVRLGQLLRANIDGVPLDLAARLLPARSMACLPILLHIHLHARSKPVQAPSRPRDKASHRPISARAMMALIDSLRQGIESLRWRPEESIWREYYRDLSYSDAEVARKKSLVSEFLDLAGRDTVWDLGANTGVYSRIAASRGIYTVCSDFDPACIELSYLDACRNDERNLLPLILDLVNPSPSLGWNHAERSSLVERGPADTVLMLALVHHLVIANNVPFGHLAGFAARVCRNLIVEFVPKRDPMVERLLASRRDVFPEYEQGAFEAAFERRFTIRRRDAVTATGRMLYLMTSKKPADPREGSEPAAFQDRVAAAAARAST